MKRRHQNGKSRFIFVVEMVTVAVVVVMVVMVTEIMAELVLLVLVLVLVLLLLVVTGAVVKIHGPGHPSVQCLRLHCREHGLGN